MEYSETRLEKFRAVLQIRISERTAGIIANAPEIEMYEHANFMSDEIVARLRAFVWSEKLRDETVIYPADWWQAFKERWFPQWLARRYPVKYTAVRYEARALYPMAKFDNEPRFFYANLRRE